MVSVFVLADMIWLGLLARDIYFKQLGHLLIENYNWAAAIVFYLVFIIGILIFAVIPAIEKGSLARAVIYGALFGFFCYATYDLTNLATLKGWPLGITFIDMVWGAVLSGLVATVGFLIGKYLMN